MKINFKNKRIRRIALLIFGAHTAVLIVHLPQAFYFNAQSQQLTDWWIVTARQAWSFYLWEGITAIILWIGNRVRIARPHLWRNVFLHLIVSILTGVFRPAIYLFGLWTAGLMSLENVQAELLKPVTYIQSITGAIIY